MSRGARDDKQDVNKTQCVPDADPRWSRDRSIPSRKEDERERCDSDVTPTCWNREITWQLTPAAQNQEVKADKPRQVQRDQPPQVDGVYPLSKGVIETPPN